MKAVITRSGGFAGLTLQREVDLTPEQLADLRNAPPPPATPDAFTYEVTAGDETFQVGGQTFDVLWFLPIGENL